MLDVGFNIGLPTILVAALTGVSNEYNKNEALTISPALASWLGTLNFHFLKIFLWTFVVFIIGSVSYLVQPLGSMLSVFITGNHFVWFIVSLPIMAFFHGNNKLFFKQIH